MKKIYLVLFVILSVFVFSCKDNLISDDLSSNQNSGAGQVKVFVKQSRLIGPELSDVSWDVLLQKDNENDTISGKNENGYYLFSGLSDGDYSIEVSGKINNVDKFTGSAKVTITNGNSVSVNVPIVAQKGTDDVGATGYATITMDMSEELLSKMGEKVFFQAELVVADDIFYIASFFDEENQILLDNQQITFAYTDYSQSPEIQTTDIPAGYYNLSFVGLEDFGYSIKLKDNLVEIGDGLTTNIVLTQNDYEIVRDYSTVLYVNENGAGDNATGSSLSDPIAFSKITRNNYADLIYLLSDVEFSNEGGSLSPNIASFFETTISSFNSTVRTISANISDYSSSITLGYGTTLKNIKLSGSNAFSFESLNIDETVILDTPIAKNLESNTDSTVLMSKSSKLVIGQNFSGELGICLFPENWQLGDTVVTFENGKPEDCNLFIFDDPVLETDFASKFYIDDNGKLAQFDAKTQWVNFAWNEVEPCLVTQTQAKNKTMTSIIDNYGYSLFDFNGISTYDEDSQTWYFIANGSDASVNTVPSLYRVSAPTEYTDIVSPEKLCEVKLDEAGQTQINVQDIYIYNDKIYLCNLFNDYYDVYVSNLNDIDFDWKWLHSTGDTVTALLVENDVIYIATTTYVDISGVTHSEIWRYKWDSGLGYTTAVDTYYQKPVPYYQTVSDNNLKVGESFPENSTFRITDLYTDGTDIYGLLANYKDVKPSDINVGEADVYMRGSVFKLVENSSRDDDTSAPIMNATQLGLRKSFPLTSDDLSIAKDCFILPRKIVGIVNKKLVIADDGMIPDTENLNVDRFVFFDLAGEISETIDVGTSFTTQASVSSNKFYTFDPLFDAQQY